MSQPFLGTVDTHQLIRFQFDPIATEIPLLYGIHQLGQFSEGVVIVVRVGCRLSQCLYHMWLGEKVRSADGQVIDGQPLGQTLLTAFIQDVENTRLELFHALGLFVLHDNLTSFSISRR